jgi:DNA-binding response OmpR family regulator
MAGEDKVHILVVDDDPLLRRLFGGKLATVGYQILYASNGADGREVARRMKPNLILMDINMPGYENGMDTAHRLKSEEETKDIPIIFLTNLDTTYDGEKKLIELAAESYIHKSIDLNDFLVKIQTFLTAPESAEVNAPPAAETQQKNTGKPKKNTNNKPVNARSKAKKI